MQFDARLGSNGQINYCNALHWLSIMFILTEKFIFFFFLRCYNKQTRTTWLQRWRNRWKTATHRQGVIIQKTGMIRFLDWLSLKTKALRPYKLPLTTIGVHEDLNLLQIPPSEPEISQNTIRLVAVSHRQVYTITALELRFPSFPYADCKAKWTYSEHSEPLVRSQVHFRSSEHISHFSITWHHTWHCSVPVQYVHRALHARTALLRKRLMEMSNA